MLVLRKLYPEGVPKRRHLFCEGAFAAVSGTAFAWWLFPNEVSLIALFLTSIITADSMERVLEWNRVAIFERHVVPLTANLSLASTLLMMFLGCVVGFSALGLALPLDLVEQLFSHQLMASHEQGFGELRFGTVSEVLVNNLYVLLFFFAIALPFQQGGVMLAIAWNASVWGSTFSVVARHWALDNGPSVFEAYARVMAACSVHMAFEAAAYTLTGLAGVFLSKAFHKHTLDSDPMLSILQSVSAMLLLASVLMGLGALWEGLLASQLVDLLL